VVELPTATSLRPFIKYITTIMQNAPSLELFWHSNISATLPVTIKAIASKVSREKKYREESRKQPVPPELST